MRIILIILLLFFASFSNAQSEGQNKLKFLPGVKAYIKQEGDVKVLRPLNEFKVGKKYCLRGSKNWDDACQDAAMEYAFGPNWREFKHVALEFLRLSREGRLIDISKLLKFPFKILISTRVHPDGSIGYVGEDITDPEDFIRNSWHAGDVKGLDYPCVSTTYKDFLLRDLWREGFYFLTLGGNNTVSITFDRKCEDDAEKICHYIPKISIVRID